MILMTDPIALAHGGGAHSRACVRLWCRDMQFRASGCDAGPGQDHHTQECLSYPRGKDHV